MRRARELPNKSALVSVPERVKIVLAMLSVAAERGEPAPKNGAIAKEIGASSDASAAGVVSLLETMDLITVVRGVTNRVITIRSTGKSTAGTITNAISYIKTQPVVRTRALWNPNRDAILMQRIADGADFEQASILIGCTGEQAAARFDQLAADLEAKQAARVRALEAAAQDIAA